MNWAHILAFVTGMVDQKLLARSEYLVAENRILKAQLKGRPKLLDAERTALAEIGHRLGRKVLARWPTWLDRTRFWLGTASLSSASLMARRLVGASDGLGSSEKSSS